MHQSSFVSIHFVSPIPSQWIFWSNLSLWLFAVSQLQRSRAFSSIVQELCFLEGARFGWKEEHGLGCRPHETLSKMQRFDREERGLHAHDLPSLRLSVLLALQRPVVGARREDGRLLLVQSLQRGRELRKRWPASRRKTTHAFLYEILPSQRRIQGVAGVVQGNGSTVPRIRKAKAFDKISRWCDQAHDGL